MSDLPIRKSIRIDDYDYSTPGAYFITICAANRENIFWNNKSIDFIRRGELCSPANIPSPDMGITADIAIRRNVGADIIRPQNVPLSNIGRNVEQGIVQMASHYQNVVVDKYCIMPDHIHLILRIESDISGRMISAPTVSTIVGSMKRWVTKQVGRSIWQRSFYDHGIRNQQDYDEIWEYIENNPLKYALKKTP